MLSYTSNFERTIPNLNFKAACATTCLVALLFIAGYEVFWRSQGYAPTYNDDKFFWSTKRNQVKTDDLVLVGASRTLFDLDQQAIEKFFAKKPVQLAIVGSSPLPILEDLAYDPSYKGFIICGVVPGLFFAPPPAPPFKKSVEWVLQAKQMSPTDYANNYLNKALESQLAYLQQEDLPLKELLKALPISNRPDKIPYPVLPPYFSKISWDRKADMIQKVLDDKAFAQRIQNGWIPLFTPPPFPDNPTPEVIGQRIEGLRQMILGRIKAAVEIHQKKGGKIIFVRLPSSNPLRELESKITPREKYWDAIIQTSGAKGYHFEDYETLKSFTCPEWSHLSAADSITYTKNLLDIIKKED